MTCPINIAMMISPELSASSYQDQCAFVECAKKPFVEIKKPGPVVLRSPAEYKKQDQK
jgi:hypothetical protein